MVYFIETIEMLILIKNRVYFSLIKDLKVYVTVWIGRFLKKVYLCILKYTSYRFTSLQEKEFFEIIN